MSPPSIDGWLTEADEEEDDEEEGAAADAEGYSLEEDDVDFDDGEDYPEDDDYDSETDISESGSSDRPLPGAYYSWPDPFDAGTEASCSTPRTGRSLIASPNQTARNSISASPPSPADCPGAQGLHDSATAKADGTTITSSSGPADASCAAGQGGMGEDEEDDEALGFFISAGGALAEDAAEAGGAETAGSPPDGPSSLLQAYVAATGDLLTSGPSAASSSSVEDAKARQIQRVFRASQSRSQSKEVAACEASTAVDEGRSAATSEVDQKSAPTGSGEPEVCIESPLCQEPEHPEKAANQLEDQREDQGCTQPSAERASPIPQPHACGRHSTEEVLRAQILAKQILVPVMLNAVFAVEARQAAAASDAAPAGEVGEVAAARGSPAEEQKSQPDPPKTVTGHQSPTAAGEATTASQAPREQDVTQRDKQADAALATPTAASVAALAHAEEMTPASQPQLPAGEAPQCVGGSKTSSSAGSSASLKRQCSSEVEGRRSGRTGSTGKGSASAAGAAAGEKGPTSSRAPGRRLICTRGRVPQATRPRQPPSRLDRKPPVPRAQRSTSSRGNTLERAAAASSASEVRPCENAGLASDPGGVQGGSSASTCCTPTRRQPEAVAAGTGPADDACISEELPCYEVSEEEFNRLVHFGLLGSPAVAEAAGAEAERYEISEEEFERLLSAGQLHVLPQEDTTGIAPEIGGEVPEAATLFCDISEAQFEQLAKAGMLQPDAALASTSNEASAAGLPWPEAGVCAGPAAGAGAADKPLTAPTKGSSSSGSKPDIEFAMGFDIHGFGIALPNGRVAAGSGCYSARYLRDLRAAEATAGGYVMKRYAGLL